MLDRYSLKKPYNEIMFFTRGKFIKEKKIYVIINIKTLFIFLYCKCIKSNIASKLRDTETFALSLFKDMENVKS